jgi:hypothetical protein
MDKLQEWIITVSVTLAGICAWVFKKLWSRIDSIEDKVHQIDSNRITRRDLDKIISVQNLILQNLLSNKKKE